MRIWNMILAIIARFFDLLWNNELMSCKTQDYREAQDTVCYLFGTE